MAQRSWVIAMLFSCVVGTLQGNSQVVIDGYTVDSTITSPATLPLGRTALLVCRVSGIPHGQHTTYQWTCPNQSSCLQAGYAGRKINNNIIAINTTSTSDGGTYTCTVTTGGISTAQNFTITIEGGEVVHSYGRLIPHEGLISTASQLQPPDTASGDGRVQCTVSNRTANFSYTGNDVLNGTTATYTIPAGNLSNLTTEGRCGPSSTLLYHYIFTSENTSPPVLVQKGEVTANSISVHFQEDQLINNSIVRVIVGFDRLDLGLPMVGQYRNNVQNSTVAFTSLVPGARYRITAWGATERHLISLRLTVLKETTAPAVPSPPRALTITRVFEGGIELNWLPPRETNGDIQHYIIRYTPLNGTEQEIITTDNTNYYNITGLERGQTYYNFTVKAANVAHTSAQSDPIGIYAHAPLLPTSTSAPAPTTAAQRSGSLPIAAVAGAAGGLLLIIIIVLVILIIAVAVRRRRTKVDFDNWASGSLHSNTAAHRDLPVPSYYGVVHEHHITDEPQDIVYEDVRKKLGKTEVHSSTGLNRPADTTECYEEPDMVKVNANISFQPHTQEHPVSDMYTVPDKTKKAGKSKPADTQQEDREYSNTILRVDTTSESETAKQKYIAGQVNGDLYAVPDKTKRDSLKDGQLTEEELLYQNTHNNPNQGRSGAELMYTAVDMTQKTHTKTRDQ